MQKLNVFCIDEVSSGVNGGLLLQCALLTMAGSVAIGVGAISGPEGVSLVIVGIIAVAMGGTAMSSAFGDASGGGGCGGTSSHVSI